MKPEITYLVGIAQWELTEDFAFSGHGVSFAIGKGFRFDLASIPRILWRCLAPFELSITAPLVHDYLYRRGGRYLTLQNVRRKLSRRQTDDLFLAVMKDEGVGWFRRTAAYHAVRLFAGSCWKENKLCGD